MFRNGINFAKSLHFCKIKTAAALIARGSRRLNCQITCLVFLCFIAVAFVAILYALFGKILYLRYILIS